MGVIDAHQLHVSPRVLRAMAADDRAKIYRVKYCLNLLPAVMPKTKEYDQDSLMELLA